MFVGLTALAGAKFVEASPVLINFESTGLSEGDSLTTEIPGLTFTDSIIAEEGSPPVAFSANNGTYVDKAQDGEPFGGFFITDPIIGGDIGISGSIEISFDIPVFDVSLRVVDIDDWEASGGLEVFTAQAFDATSTLLETFTITAADPGTGDGIATLVEFDASDISLLTMIVAQQTGRAGWGVDNLSYTPIPIPAAIWFLGSGLIGLFGFRKKLRK